MNDPLPIPVLTWHRITAGTPTAVNGVSVVRFRRQLESLRQQGVKSVTLREYFQRQGLRTRGEKLLLFTFDDGLADLADHALPLMESSGFRGVIFAVTGFLDKFNTWDPARLGGPHRHFSAAELRQLAARGWETAWHGHSHRSFAALTDDQIRRELAAARRLLPPQPGTPATLAYPFGVWRLRHLPLLRDAGVDLAFATAAGKDFPLTVPRLSMYAFTLKDLDYETLTRIYQGKRTLGKLLESLNLGSRIFQRLQKKDLDYVN